MWDMPRANCERSTCPLEIVGSQAGKLKRVLNFNLRLTLMAGFCVMWVGAGWSKSHPGQDSEDSSRSQEGSVICNCHCNNTPTVALCTVRYNTSAPAPALRPVAAMY